MKKKILIPVSIILIVIVICFIYLLTGNYKASKDVLKYLESSDDVKVLEIKDGYYFDGPGEDSAIIFYPGAKVDYKAYSKLMYDIALNGKDTFLLKMPFNIAFFGINKARNIITEYKYDNWYLAGHSLGGVVANLYVSKNPNNIKGIIALASYPTKKLPNDIEYISIYGSNDKVLNRDKYEEAKKYLPDNYQEYIIEGGNHAYFGNYGEQKGDGKSSISREEQQEEVLNILFKEN